MSRRKERSSKRRDMEINDRLTAKYKVNSIKNKNERIDSGERATNSSINSPNMLIPVTENQQTAIEQLNDTENKIVFLVGPAGSAKTTLAIEWALEHVKDNRERKILITRPMVDADKEVGFLPGDLNKKYSVWINPIKQLINRRYGVERTTYMFSQEKISCQPLNFIRGATFNDHVVILDEAQNVTPSQMKLMLTRMGTNSKLIITGDLDQTDLKMNPESTGLAEATRVLSNSKGIVIIKFTSVDIVRDGIVKTVVEAYERYKQEQSKQQKIDMFKI